MTEVSGRGIGMDVARDVAQQLRGQVSVRNRPGAGATVELVVPLTLLSMNGLIVEAGGTVATMPLDAVRRAPGWRPARRPRPRPPAGWRTTTRWCRSCRWPAPCTRAPPSRT